MSTQSPLEILTAERARRVTAFAADIAALDGAIAALRGPLKVQVDGGTTSGGAQVPFDQGGLPAGHMVITNDTDQPIQIQQPAQPQQPAQQQPAAPTPAPQAQRPAPAPQAAVQAPAAEDPDADAPWSNPAQAPASPAGESGAAPTGRRKNEDIARDLGITLDEVREWKKANNHENARVTKGDIETAAAVKHAQIGQGAAHDEPQQAQQPVAAPQGEVQFAPMEGVQTYQTEAYPQQQVQPQYAPAQHQPQMAPQAQPQAQPQPQQQAPQFAPAPQAQQQYVQQPQAPQGGQPQFVAPAAPVY